MTELKPSVVLTESKFMIIEEDSKATYADYFVVSYFQMLNKTELRPNLQRQVHLFLFINPCHIYNQLGEIVKKENLIIHDYYSTNIHDLSKDYEINLDFTLKDSSIDNQSIVVINCLSSLILTVGLAKAMRLIGKLSSRVSQLICIFNRDMCMDKFPSIETLGSTYVQLARYEKTVTINDIIYQVSITHRKKGSGIQKSNLLAIQNIDTHEITFEKIPVIFKMYITNSEPTKTPQATFRTEMNPRELEQRNKTPLPYVLNSDTPNESKILYVPDDADDFDEEDPDDDLPF